MNNVLIIGGSELSLNSGHLTAMGYQLPEYMFPPEPQDAINEVNHYNGVCFLAHPFDEKIPWTNWEIKNFTGIEILNVASFVYKMKFYHIPSFLIQSLFNSKYSILNSLEYPKKNLFQWDSFNTKQKTFGIYALDAHAKLELSERIQFNFPSYKTMFEIFTLYVKVDGEINRDSFQSASTIISSIIAIRSGL